MNIGAGSSLFRPVLLFGVPGFVVGVIFVSIVWHPNRPDSDTPSERIEEDANRDGKPDTFFYYSGLLLDRAEYDRNFDGKCDFWLWHREGLPSRGRGDNNFDGVVDFWETYRDGILAVRETDTDWNGLSDVTEEYLHGLPTKLSWHPNGAKTVRVEYFENGTKVREEADWDGDGVFETDERFDAFGKKLNHIEPAR